MKGLFFVRLGVISLLLTSCLKEEEPQQGKTVLEFSVEQTQAKVAPGNNDGASITLLWEAGDNINVNGHESETLTQGGTGKASFTFAGKLDSPYNAIYPASAVVSTESAAAHFNLPSIQNSSEGKFDRNACILIGKGSQKDISLSHAMAYIAFVFEKGSVDAVLSSLEITAAGGEKISGGFTTDYATLSAKGDASSTVTVTAGAAVGSGTAITVAIPAQNYQNGFSLTVKDTEGRTMSKRTEGRFNAAAGHFYTTALTYQPDVDYPEYLYIAGDAVEWGWNLEDSRAAIPEAENGIYRADITFDFGEDGGKGFKFCETSYWGTEYGMTSDSEFGNIGIDLRSSIGGDPQFYLGQKGYQSGEYTITVNLNTKKVTLLSAGVPETLYMAGGFNNWEDLVQMERIADGRFQVTDYEFNFFSSEEDVKGHGIKFFESSDWTGEWGSKENWETGDYRGWELASYAGGAPQFYPLLAGFESGTYTVLVDFETMTVTLKSSSDEPEPEPEPEYPETLYMSGGFNGWSPVQLEKIAEGKFRIEDYEFDFFSSEEDVKGHGIKFFESTEDGWPGQWGPKENYETQNYRGWELASYAEGAPQFYPLLAGFESGTYTVLVDFETMTVTLKSSSDEPEPEPEPEYPETLYMSGGFNGWSPVQLEKIAEGKFRIEDYEFDFFSSEEDVKGHGIKFFESSDWTGEWGSKENWETGDYRGWELASYAEDAPQFYPLLAGLESGIYTVLVDFTAMTVSLTSENDEPDVPVNLPSTIYIAGDPFEWKWDYPERIDGVNGVFEIRCSLNFTFDKAPYDGFKLFGANAEGYIDWNVIYGMRPGSTKNNISFDLVSNIGGDPQFYLKNLGYDSGNYILTFNFSTMKLTVTESDEPVTSKLLSDKNATEQTENLYANMMELVETGTMFGVQMPTTQGINYTSSWTAGANSTNRSDTKDLTGSHPAVCGWEIGSIEYGWANNLDGVSFETIRAHIIAAYNRGAVNTISWHCHNPVTDGRYNSASDNPISAILPGGSHHDKFCGWMDKAAEFLLSLKTSDGTLIPVIFRPWHEHTDRAQGSGFWWSVGNNSNDNYKLLWQMTFNYLTRTKGVHNLIWAYSPDLHHLCWNESGLDKYVYMNAWPGDAYVDILGLDAYQTSYSNFDASVANVVNHALSLAEEKGKLFAITETGLSNNNPGHYKYYYNEKWWTEKLYPLLSGKKVSYAMAWRNDGYPTDGQYPEYYNAFPGCYSADDFLVFAGKGDILLEDDIDNMYK